MLQKDTVMLLAIVAAALLQQIVREGGSGRGQELKKVNCGSI